MSYRAPSPRDSYPELELVSDYEPWHIEPDAPLSVLGCMGLAILSATIGSVIAWWLT